MGRRLKSSGAALVELSILMPFLLAGIGLLLELGRAINLSTTLSRVSYEAGRYAANLPGLVPGAGVASHCSGTDGSECSPILQQIGVRINDLILRSGLDPLPVNYRARVRENQSGVVGSPLVVEVSLTYVVRPTVVGVPIGPLQLAVSVVSPYLYGRTFIDGQP